MARIVLVGAGVVALGTAMLLAGDGHQVIVLERDPEGPPADPVDAWERWQRPGLNQFRMAHTFLARSGLRDKTLQLGSGWRDAPPFGPTREQLLALVSA